MKPGSVGPRLEAQNGARLPQAARQALTLAYFRDGIKAGGQQGIAARRAFRKLPFAQQVPLIAEYARERLGEVDAIIRRSTANKKPANAVALWQEILACEEDLGNARKVGHLYPELREENDQIVGLFGSCYVFWVNSFYSCEIDGTKGTSSARLSPAMYFSETQKAQIDEASGMPSLGNNMQRYATYLFMTED